MLVMAQEEQFASNTSAVDFIVSANAFVRLAVKAYGFIAGPLQSYTAKGTLLTTPTHSSRF